MIKNDNKTAIERGFPYGKISKLAERESYRKEIWRPIYYLHKWWAKRLGSVFRAIVLGSCATSDGNIFNLFYNKNNFSTITVYDPMMGSGVTIGEAKKIGCKVIGRDINPVSYLLVKAFLNDYNILEVENIYEEIKNDVSNVIKKYYKTRIEVNRSYKIVDVLYYFWVMVLTCPECGQDVDLFNNRIFVKNAYPKKNPAAKSLCPNCNAINSMLVTDSTTICNKCKTNYNPHNGNVGNRRANCPKCDHSFSIIDTQKNRDDPPKYRMYAKTILNHEGKREYHEINDYDLQLYRETSKELKKLKIKIPNGNILPGYNTNQILNYNFKYWYQLFNDRQLLCLGLLRNRIQQIKEPKYKELFACLFSGCLEFNSMFCSFKGEGTGAVRHMFSHHILKPERTPLEANVWGTPKSSGSFSTLFSSRVLRALKYKDNPFELALSPEGKSLKKYELNQQIVGRISTSYYDFKTEDFDTYLSCGSSDSTDIDDRSVDIIVTDPPFFDNVHYSELADFFFVWQKEIFGNQGVYEHESTRSLLEIQDADPEKFSNKLSSVYIENNRVLKDDGIMTFTFHHSNTIGWISLLESLDSSNFYIVNSYPVKSEMSVSVALSQSKSPINYDMVIVCRKKYVLKNGININKINLFKDISSSIFTEAKTKTEESLKCLNSLKFELSHNDIKCILTSYLMHDLTRIHDVNDAKNYLYSMSKNIDEYARTLLN